ncbi:hypothetical protein ES703_87943 [subsurface metagenome]
MSWDVKVPLPMPTVLFGTGMVVSTGLLGRVLPAWDVQSPPFLI